MYNKYDRKPVEEPQNKAGTSGNEAGTSGNEAGTSGNKAGTSGNKAGTSVYDTLSCYSFDQSWNWRGSMQVKFLEALFPLVVSTLEKVHTNNLTFSCSSCSQPPTHFPACSPPR